MVKVGVISTLLLLASTAAAWVGDTEGYQKDGSDQRRFYDVGERGDFGKHRDGGRHDEIQRQLSQTSLTRPLITEAPTLPPPSSTDRTRLHIRQDAPPNPIGTIISQAVLGPEGVSVSSSLSSSASSALSLVSISFQSQISALSSRSSADLVSATQSARADASSSAAASASSAIAAATAGVAASASSAIAAATTGVAASASSVIAAASASVAASASSVIAAASISVSASASRAIASILASVSEQSNQAQATGDASSSQITYFDTTPPTPSQSDNGVLEVTPSQLVAVIIGTIIGTAIFTLVVIYIISVCRNRRHNRAYERYDSKKSTIALHSLTNVSSRGENLSREEKQRINLPSEVHPALVPDPPPKDYPRMSRRPALTPLPEESPRISHGQNGFDERPLSNGDPAKFAVSTLGLGPEPADYSDLESINQPSPVKLHLTRRRSIGGSKRVHVVRVGTDEKTNASSNNGSIPQTKEQQDAETDSVSSFLVLQKHSPIVRTPSSEALPNVQRPAAARTPSSGTLPNITPASEYPSPLKLNPTTGYVAPSQPLPGSRAKPKDQNHIAFLLNQPADGTPRQPSPQRTGNATISISPVSNYSETFASPTWPGYISPLSPPPKSPMRVLDQSDEGLRDAIGTDLEHYGTGKPLPGTSNEYAVGGVAGAGSVPDTPTRLQAFRLFPRVSAAYSAVGGKTAMALSRSGSHRRSRSMNNIEFNPHELGLAIA